MFLKLKTEARGNLDWVRYIANFFASEGIRLDKEEIRPNTAKRGMAKFCLNSMWGKVTERNNRMKSKIISDPQELYRFRASPGIEMASLVFGSDDLVLESWRFVAEEEIPSSRNKIEIIGAYVTVGVRQHLYSYLDRLQERAIYCDTDSVMYVQPTEEPALVETGHNLGAMSSEIKPSEFMEEFVSAGPKTIPTRQFIRRQASEKRSVNSEG